MQIVSAIFLYLMWWWIVLFAILPIGNKQKIKKKKGNDIGAPINPNIKFKLKLTSLVAFIFWAVNFYLIESGLLGRLLDIGN